MNKNTAEQVEDFLRQHFPDEEIRAVSESGWELSYEVGSAPRRIVFSLEAIRHIDAVSNIGEILEAEKAVEALSTAPYRAEFVEGMVSALHPKYRTRGVSE